MLTPVLGRASRRKAIPRLACALSSSPASHVKSHTAPTRTHQRRNSSSKTSSSSKDDPHHVSATADPPAKDSEHSSSHHASREDSTTPARKPKFSKAGRTKSKDGLAKATNIPLSSKAYALPSVPSTQHLHRQVDVHLASLFAFHRPISVSTPLPVPRTDKDFSQIFSSKSSAKPSPNQVMFTLSSAVQTLEKTSQQQQEQQHSQQLQSTQAQQNLRKVVTQALQQTTSGQHSAPSEASQPVMLSIEEILKNFRPFHPPPPPVPIQDAGTNGALQSARIVPAQRIDLPAAIVEEISEQETPSTKTIVPRQPFLNRLYFRYLRREEVIRERRREMFHAISVRRQRKLKMKKHKYKKLMRRTRNLRRRQDRL